MIPVICGKGHRNYPLTDGRKTGNSKKSKVRGRVGHVFGFMEQSMRGLVVKTVRLARIKANVAMTSLVCNVLRFCQKIRFHGGWLVGAVK